MDGAQVFAHGSEIVEVMAPRFQVFFFLHARIDAFKFAELEFQEIKPFVVLTLLPDKSLCLLSAS